VGAASGAMVDDSRCGKVVHGGAVLVAAAGSLEGNRGRRYMVAQWQRNKVAQWGRQAGGRKAIHGGSSSLYSR
jgi:hypothetical protein